MNDNTFQLVMIVFDVTLPVIVDTLSSIWKNVQHLREFTVCVQLELLHCLEIELESLQSYYQDLWKSLETYPFDCFYLTITFFTKICVI